MTKFKEALNQGMSNEQAAFETITGGWATEKGFTNVVVHRTDPPSNVTAANIQEIELTFFKP